ncbi:hypothetical protein BO79DRAFT_287780 [Aspergillus costaricaensis CBS 115574]|uniref:Uncharacterized protein n=1 Tax=Aspergillus costaricaensis CBS 115574 TaxID=1448317 RepID=A0ACD1ID61_9EURO|nr:hypothetical protein BO79DRAFT_287780 [Aspergillus costaricaensis CBS 115574]RAK88289.1 hypothetical protein BO79DRAFT_287780 [Aspergillus costaricaensis CBS 115574]
MAARMLDDAYTSPKEEFLIGLLAAMEAGNPTEYCAGRGYDVTQPTIWEAFVMMGTAGPHFDLRLAGGVYRFADNEFGLFELFVNSAKSTIHVDGVLMDPVSVKEGVVSFVANDMLFIIQFQCGQPAGVEQSQPGFEGEIWPGSQEAQKTSISGRKYYSWGDSNDTTTDFSRDVVPAGGPGVSREKMEAAAAVRVDASFESIVVCMDLLNGCYDLQGGAAGSPFGPVMNSFIVLTGTILCAGAGAYVSKGNWPAAIGAGISGMGVSIAGVIVACLYKRFAFKQAYEMKYFIRQIGNKKEGDSEGLLSWDTIVERIESEVKRLTPDDLKQDSKTNAKIIQNRIEKAYNDEARAQVSQKAFDKYKGYRRIAGNDYREKLEAGVEAKFGDDIDPEIVGRRVLVEVDKAKARLEAKDLESQIEDLLIERDVIRQEWNQKLEDIPTTLPEEEREKEKERIDKIYEKEVERVENEKKEKDKEKTEAEEKGKLTDFEKLRKEFKEEIRDNRTRAKNVLDKNHLPPV